MWSNANVMLWACSLNRQLLYVLTLLYVVETYCNAAEKPND
jgi:hypothetical protein